MKFFEHAKRSVAKTITYRLLIVFSTFIITYLITGKLVLTLEITTATNIINTCLYFLHERIWNKVHWGKAK